MLVEFGEKFFYFSFYIYADLHVRSFLQGYTEDEVYVCESRYAHKSKSFKKIKVTPLALFLSLSLFLFFSLSPAHAFLLPFFFFRVG